MPTTGGIYKIKQEACNGEQRPEHSGYVIVRYCKGSKYRELPLNATARRTLGDYLAKLSGEWLFPSKNGPMTRRLAEKVIVKYARLAGVEATPYRLRHTFCKMLVDAGESLDRVAVLAGHENLNTTARYTWPRGKPGKSCRKNCVGVKNMQDLLTNEEKRVSIYQIAERPTDPKTVTPDTPLEDLNLNWREVDLPERERTKHVHRLHPYLGKFIPQLVEIFLRKYFRPGQTVLDPFCGSGTTLVQANELGINSVGYDISGFNVLLCRAKTAKYDIQKARKEVLDILRKTDAERKKVYGNRQLSWWDGEGSALTFETKDEYLLNWYAPRALTELLIYRHYIKDYEYQDLLKIILSRSARSARLTTHFDLDFPKKPQREPYWCYKHSRICQPTTEAFKFLCRYSYDTISRIEEFAGIRTDARVEIFHEDSRKADFPPVHGVITSPPYVGLIDYHEQHAYAYHLLGLEDRRDGEIGAASKGTSQRAKQEYQEDITEVFRQVGKSLLPGGRVIVVAADTANLYDSIAEQAGFRIEDVINRHVNRRTGRRSSEFFESVFIWRKG